MAPVKPMTTEDMPGMTPPVEVPVPPRPVVPPQPTPAPTKPKA